MIKIFAIEPHSDYQGDNPRTSGVDFARIIQPMKYMGKGFEVTIHNNKSDEALNWDTVTKEHDFIFTSYTPNDVGYVAMAVFAKKNNCKIIIDFDDNLWEILPDNIAHQVFHKGGKAIHDITCIAKDVDYITTTNSYLKNAIAHACNTDFKKIFVMPNYVDLELYNHVPPFKDDLQVVITHFGSTTHFSSLQSDFFFGAIDRIMKLYPNVVFQTIGSVIPKMKDRWGVRYIHKNGSQDVMNWAKNKYPEIVGETDIFVAPLIDNVYNRSKSSIKYLEISAAKKPGCYQDIRQYKEIITHGKDGMLCATQNDWYNNLVELIDNKQLRKSMGEQAYETIKEHTIQKNINRYRDMFTSLVD